MSDVPGRASLWPDPRLPSARSRALPPPGRTGRKDGKDGKDAELNILLPPGWLTAERQANSGNRGRAPSSGRQAPSEPGLAGRPWRRPGSLRGGAVASGKGLASQNPQNEEGGRQAGRGSPGAGPGAGPAPLLLPVELALRARARSRVSTHPVPKVTPGGAPQGGRGPLGVRSPGGRCGSQTSRQPPAGSAVPPGRRPSPRILASQQAGRVPVRW